METYCFTIDFTGVKDYDGIYPAIKKGLELPDYWGEELSIHLISAPFPAF